MYLPRALADDIPSFKSYCRLALNLGKKKAEELRETIIEKHKNYKLPCRIDKDGNYVPYVNEEVAESLMDYYMGEGGVMGKLDQNRLDLLRDPTFNFDLALQDFLDNPAISGVGEEILNDLLCKDKNITLLELVTLTLKQGMTLSLNLSPIGEPKKEDSSNKEVYLVEDHVVPGGSYYTDSEIYAAFSTLQKAEEYTELYGGDIITWTLDRAFFRPKEGLKLYLLEWNGPCSSPLPDSVQKPSSIKEAKLSRYSVKKLNKWTISSFPSGWLISLYCEARDEQHAEEIWTEKFTEYLRVRSVMGL
ncbi:MAG: hypothetical protein KDH96_05760 [Candidatus Riesia sp.]|nr:hypothetical protein [Candidatus Riesia sp.]